MESSLACLRRVGCTFQHFQGALLMPLDELVWNDSDWSIFSLYPKPRAVSGRSGPNVFKITKRVEWSVEHEWFFFFPWFYHWQCYQKLEPISALLMENRVLDFWGLVYRFRVMTAAPLKVSPFRWPSRTYPSIFLGKGQGSGTKQEHLCYVWSHLSVTRFLEAPAWAFLVTLDQEANHLTQGTMWVPWGQAWSYTVFVTPPYGPYLFAQTLLNLSHSIELRRQLHGIH